jgi:hypothetical protein
VDTIRLLESNDEIIVIIVRCHLIQSNDMFNIEGKLWPATEVLPE